MGGLPHAQYSVHSSENPATRGIRYDPLRYGLKPTRYRVRHFGHSTQWRTRGVMARINQDRFVDPTKVGRLRTLLPRKTRATIFLATSLSRSSGLDFSGPYG